MASHAAIANKYRRSFHAGPIQTNPISSSRKNLRPNANANFFEGLASVASVDGTRCIGAFRNFTSALRQN